MKCPAPCQWQSRLQAPLPVMGVVGAINGVVSTCAPVLPADGPSACASVPGQPGSLVRPVCLPTKTLGAVHSVKKLLWCRAHVLADSPSPLHHAACSAYPLTPILVCMLLNCCIIYVLLRFYVHARQAGGRPTAVNPARSLSQLQLSLAESVQPINFRYDTILSIFVEGGQPAHRRRS